MIKQKKSGQLIVISGPSGAGKDSVVSRLLETNKNIWLSISATSRSPRGNEKDGINYYFLSKEDFEEKIKEDYFLEYAKYTDNYYGTPKANIMEKLNNTLKSNEKAITLIALVITIIVLLILARN